MLLPNSHKEPNPRQSNSFSHEKCWQELSHKAWTKRLGENCRDAIAQATKIYAVSSISYQVLIDLKAIASRNISPDIQTAIKVIITIAGGFTFGSGMRVITSGLGIFAVPAGLLGGALASFIVDRLAVDANAQQIKKGQALRRIQPLREQCLEARQQENPKPVAELFYREQVKHIRKMEAEVINPSFPAKAVGAIVLSAIEYAVAIWIVQQVAALSSIPLLIRILVSALPVILTHAAALAQAIAFELPSYARKQMQVYREYLVPHPDWDNETIQRWALEQEWDNGRISAGMSPLIDPHATEPIPPLAQIAFEQEFLNDGIQQLYTQSQNAEREMWKAYDIAVEQLPEQFTAPDIEEAGRTEAEIRKFQREIEQQRQLWITEQTEALKERTQRDIDRLRDEYDGSVALWQSALSQAEQQYKKQYQRWERELDDDVDDEAA